MLLLDSDICLDTLTPDFTDILENTWKILETECSAIVCMQSGNTLHKRDMDFIQFVPGMSVFFPCEGYGYGIAGGAMSVKYRDFKKVNGFRTDTGANGKPSLYGSNDGRLTLDLWNTTKKPICVVKELQVYHPPEPDKKYQEWKNKVQQEHLQYGHALTERGFYQ